MKHYKKMLAVAFALVLCVAWASAAVPMMDEAAVEEPPLGEEAVHTTPAEDFPAEAPATETPAGDPATLSATSIGTGLSWYYGSANTLVISGTGAMRDFDCHDRYTDNDPPWPSTYWDDVKAIVVNEGVTYIGQDSFYRFRNLETVTLPESLVEIGSCAFANTPKLTTVHLPSNLVTIGSGAFSATPMLTDIRLPDGLVKLDAGAFYNSGIPSIRIPASLTNIGKEAFTGCTALERVDITDLEAWCQIPFPDADSNPLTWGHNLYLNDKLVTHLRLPEYLGRIQPRTFQGCTSITRVSLPAVLTYIDEYAFAGCTGLETPLEFPDTLLSIGQYAFSGCENLQGIRMPQAIQTMGQYAFSGCKSLGTELTFPGTLATIGAYAFSECTSLESVHFSEGVRTIGAGAFDQCTGLEQVHFSSSVANIGNSAFSQCTKLQDPLLPEGLKTIGESAFYRCNALTEITVPSGVTTVNRSAFAGCDELTRLVFGGTGETVVTAPFRDCPKLTEVIYQEGVQTVEVNASGCTMLKEITLPSTVSSFSMDYGGSLTDIHVHEDNPTYCSVDGVLFSKNKKTLIRFPGVGKYNKSYIIPAGTTTLADNAFYRSALCYVYVPEGVTTIGKAFYYATELRGLTLPSSFNTTIARDSFWYCSSLRHINLGGTTYLSAPPSPSYPNTTQDTKGVFTGCAALTSVSIEKTLTSISNYTFNDSPLLSTLYCESYTKPTYSASSSQTNNVSLLSASFNLGNAIKLKTIPNEHGFLELTRTLGKKGDAIPFIVLPKPGYKPASITADHGTVIGNRIVLSGAESYSLVTLSVTFEKDRSDEEPVSSGLCGDAAAWSLYADGTLSITGEGKLDDFAPGASSWYPVRDSIQTVEIAGSITGIGAYAFQDIPGLDVLDLPGSITTIGENAFAGCTALKDVLWPGEAMSDITISDENAQLTGAYWHCNYSGQELVRLTADAAISLSANLAVKGETIPFLALPPLGYRFIEAQADGNATIEGRNLVVNAEGDFTAIHVSATLQELRPGAQPLYDGVCGAALRWCLYEDGTLFISGAGAMTNYTSASASRPPWYPYTSQIKMAIIADGVTSIGNYAFYNCTALKWIALSSNLASVGTYAFNNTSALGDVFYPGTSKTSMSIGSNNSCLNYAYWHFGYNGGDIVTLSKSDTRVTLPCTRAYKGERVAITSTPYLAGHQFQTFTIDHGTADDQSVTVAAEGEFDTVMVGAEYLASTCTVSFYLNGGSMDVTSKGVPYGSPYGELPVPTRTGYTFTGWSTSTSLSATMVTEETIVTYSHTLYAHWSANIYTVTFDPTGGTANTTEKTVSYASTYGTLPTPTRTGYTFAGWFTLAEGGSQVTSTTTVSITADQTLYAHWTANSYTVTFYPNRGTVSPTSQSVTYDAPYGELPTPIRTGYIFTGWHTAASDGDQVTAESICPTAGNHTLYAHWTAASYPLSFDAVAGVASPEGKTVTYDATYGELPTLTRAGYTFVGWFTAASGGSQVTASTRVEITAGQTLYAHWTAKTYTVSYAPGGDVSTPSSKTVTFDAPYGALPTVTKAGYTFDGWFTEKEEGYQITAASIVGTAENHTLYAHWTAKSCTITFNANGGVTDTTSKQVTYNEAYGELPVPTRTEYTFTGWYTAASNGNQVKAETVVKITAGQTLFARWTASTYPVSFDPGTGVSAPADKTVTYNASYGTLPTVTKAGYSFDGWFTLEEGGSQVTSSTAVTITEAQTLYAHWTAKSYTVTFDATGGSVTPTSRSVVYDAAYGTLPTPTRTGYTFAGWYTAINGGDEVTAESICSTAKNHTLYAHWTASIYPVHFDAVAGVASPESKNVTYGAPYGELPALVRTGYTFVGWFTAASGGSQVKEETVVKITADQTLYAHWTASTYTVSYAPGAGIAPLNNKTVTFDKAYGALPTVSKAGYTFDGWFTEKEEGYQVTASSIVGIAKNHTLYAHWTANKYTVTFDPNGGATSATSKQVTFDGAYGELPVPTRTGYSFDGWFTAAIGGDQVTAESICALTTGQTLYAHWTVGTHTVSFDPGAGTVSPGSVGVTYGVAYGPLPTPAWTGHAFDGWFTQADGGSQVTALSLVSLTADQTLYAHWSVRTYTITFDPNGGVTDPAVKAVTYALPYGDLPVPLRAGYSFAGWFTASSGGQEVTAETVVEITADQTLFAHWTASTYAVHFDAGAGAVSPAGKDVTFGAAYGALPTPTLAGRTFAGWFTQADGGDRIAPDTLVHIAGDHALYARWASKTYTVTFDPGAGIAAPDGKTVAFDGAYGALPTVTKTGYTFDGWFTEKEEGYLVTAASIVGTAENHTLYAHWTAKKYTVTFDPNGGVTDPVSTEVTYNAAYGALPTPERPGYTFDGWSTAAIGGHRVTAESVFQGSANQTLFAHWTGNRYTLSFDPGEGNAAPESQTAVFGSAYGELPTLTRTGYTLDGWYTAAVGGSKVTATSLVATARDHTLHARWTANTYTVTFHAGGGTVNPTSKTVSYAAAYGELPIPTKPGYAFGGWYTDPVGGDPITSASVFDLTEDQTLYVRWTLDGGARGTEYRFAGLAIQSRGQSVDAIPTGSFYAEVSVENLASTAADVIAIATYTAGGQMLGVQFVYGNVPLGYTFTFGTSVDNSGGKVAAIKAFVLSTDGGLKPLAEAIQFPAEP